MMPTARRTVLVLTSLPYPKRSDFRVEHHDQRIGVDGPSEPQCHQQEPSTNAGEDFDRLQGGRGGRQRKEVDYSDSLTEKEWLKAIEDGTLNTDQEKKRRRKKTMMNADMDDDEDNFVDDYDGFGSKSSKSTGKRKLKEINKPLPTKIYKQMQTILDFVIKYRDKFVEENKSRFF